MRPRTPLERTVAAFLGALLIDGQSISRVANAVTPEMMSGRPSRLIYEAMLNLYRRGLDVDYVTVATELETNGKLAEAGGDATLTDLINLCPTSLYLSTYAEQIVGLHRQDQPPSLIELRDIAE